MDTENVLDTYIKMKSGGAAPRRQQNDVPQGEQPLTGSLEYLNEAAFGKYDPSMDTSESGWSAQGELERLKQGITDEQLERSGLPEYLKESFRRNPANDTKYADAVMNELTNKISERNGGFNAAKRIMEKVESTPKRKPIDVKETPQRVSNGGGGIDYSLIRDIVEEAVRRNISEMVLNNGGADNKQAVRQLVMKPGEKFIFLDHDDNIYECEFKYRGKNKKKKQ